jgi:hypothetical protein
MLLALISAAFTAEAGAAAGRVDFSVGGVTVSGTDGRERPLAKGVDLDSGDTVRTNDGRAQIRFSDGAYVSLQPNTDFSIKDYHYEGKTDGSERGFFGLTKGAMRAVTGFIGRINKKQYAITTPTATIGIRGTGGRIEVLLDGSTIVAGTSGIWVLSNPSGTIDVPAGTFGRAPSAPNQPPTRTSDGPTVGPAPLPPQPVFIAGEQRDPTGAPVNLIPPLVTGPGYAAAIAYTPSSGGSSTGQSNLDAVFTSTGQLTDIQLSTPSFGFGFKLGSDGTHAEFGTDGILAWGRWTGSVTQNCDCVNPQVYGADQGLHYVVGLPTLVMPTSGSATYAMIGATSPTYSTGGTGAFTGSLTVNFGSPFYDVSGNFTAKMSDATYSWNASTSCSSGSSFSMFGNVTRNDAACGNQGCFASMNGFFAGASAQRVGLSYAVTDTELNKSVLGAAAFAKK